MPAPPTPQDLWASGRRGLQVPFAEMGIGDGSSPTFRADLEGQSVTRRLRVAWDDMPAAAWQLLGTPFLDSQGKLRRYLPQTDWLMPSLVACHVGQAQGLGWREKIEDDVGSTAAYQYAALEVTFGTRPYPILAEDAVGSEFERFVEVETAAEGDYLSFPEAKGKLKWSEAHNYDDGNPAINTPTQDTLGRITPIINYVFRWHQIPDAGLPEAKYLDTIGRINKEDFGPGDLDDRLFFPARTLLLLGAGWRRVFLPYQAEPGWTVELMCKYNRAGWDKKFNFRAQVPDWYQVSLDGTNYPSGGNTPDRKLLFDERDYNKLFRTDS